MDLFSPMDVVIPAHEWVVIPLGLKIQIPQGWEGQIRPRSGLAARQGITVLNAPGTIDADFRGELAVVLINLGKHDYTLMTNERVAQIVFCPVGRAILEPVTNLGQTQRGSGGFGSTGK
jgi:dUTP pyrophosphatase